MASSGRGSLLEESDESSAYSYHSNYFRDASGSASGNGSVTGSSEHIMTLPPPKRDGLFGENLRRSQTITGQHNASYPAEMDFSRVPQPTRPGERTVSTSIRLRRQGFKMSKSSAANNFAVKSIRRGSDEWNMMIKPFVSDLAFRSLEYRRFQSEVSFRPYTCHAAVLFVDLSNYSSITAAIAHRGAHALSETVNAYLSRLLDIVRTYGGDVVKFAGDAVLIVWEGQEEDLQMNATIAAKCAVEMQQSAGSHEVEGTDLCFRIHIGLCCGALESEIFAAPNHVNMQRLYHSVGGESLVEISELVGIAKPGEICISDDMVALLGSCGSYRDIEGYNDCRLLINIDVDRAMSERMEIYVEQSMSDRLMLRNKRIEEDFIHPCVLRFLGHGGLSPTQIAQMRNLCVLFIAMTSKGSSVNWLMEVQSILDKNRCPIVQIIDDDKGVHLVAAVNLYEAIPETGLMGLEVCHELVEKQVGCAIGMAQGSAWCGVTGCGSFACRWDITGPPAVRAARLMQYALRHETEVAIDQSVYNDPIAATRMSLLESKLAVKGTKEPIPVYTISQSQCSTAFRVLETMHGRVHDDKVKEIEDHISGDCNRCAVICTGIPLSGKKIVCQRAAGNADLVPYLHVSNDAAGFLQLASTVAHWFKYVENENVRHLANSVLEHIERNRWSRAHDECVDLVTAALEEGLQACFVVDRIQFLDDFSLSLMRECLHGRRLRRYSSNVSDHSSSSRNGTDPERSEELSSEWGKICFLCTHVSLYNYKSASELVQDITRSHRSLHIPIVQVGETSQDDLRTLVSDLIDMKADERWLDTYSEAAGYCAGYFIERVAAIRNLSGKLWSQGKRGIIETTQDLSLTIPQGNVRQIKQLPVSQVTGDVAMRYYQIFDGLPPLFQTICKILKVSARTGFFRLPRTVMWEVLNDLIADGVEMRIFSILVDELREMCVVKVDHEDHQEVLAFQSPALGDIALDVSTPEQIKIIASRLIDRLEPFVDRSFKIPLVVANLHLLLQEDDELTKELYKQGCQAFLRESVGWEPKIVSKWKETIADEIIASRIDSALDILSDSFAITCPLSKPPVQECITLVKSYMPPVSTGPLGHSLSVLCRNLFHTYGEFHGYDHESILKIQKDSRSASERYLKEMDVVEAYLSDHGFAENPGLLDEERKSIKQIAAPASSDVDIVQRAKMFLEQFVPKYIGSRIRRLYSLVDDLRERETIPEVVQRSEQAIRRAYKVFRERTKSPEIAAQDALMILATSNWKPRQLPEFLPMLHYQTVARIRNKVLKRLTDPELFIFKHQQTFRDLEAFLIVTPLLYEAHDQGRC